MGKRFIRDTCGMFVPGHPKTSPGRRGRKCKAEDYTDILQTVYGMNEAQLATWELSPDRNQYELVVAAWLKRARAGDMTGIREVLDRLIGKVTQTQVIKQQIIEQPDLSNLTDEELEQWEQLSKKASYEN